MHRLFLCCVIPLVLVACNSTSVAPELSEGTTRQPAHYEDVTITSFDGTPIAATIFVPALAKGETAPLILHGNGWNDTRVHEPSPITYDPQQFYHDMHAGMVTRMWKAGYVVVSIDTRGWGESGGQINVMDPQLEVRDFSSVIDWAEANLPVTRRADGRAIVGAAGGSYGGGFQLMLAAQDSRVVAISPWVTWYDLAQALAPSKVQRTTFTLLYAAGLLDGHMAPWVTAAWAEAFAGVRGVNLGALRKFHEHSPAAFCEKGQYPHVDALLVQGTRDIVFDLNEALHNMDCIAKGGGDVRLLTVPNGHIIYSDPQLQLPPTSSTCGPVDPFESVVAWYNEKLRGQTGAAAAVPRVCISTSDTTAWIGAVVPHGGEKFAVPTTMVIGPSLPIPMAAPDYFVPLEQVERPMQLAGLPLADLEMDGLPVNVDPVVFVGIGLRRNGVVSLLNDQLLPMRGLGSHKMELTAVGQVFQVGDEIGLAIYTSSAQYFGTGTRAPIAVSISGQVELPLQ